MLARQIIILLSIFTLISSQANADTALAIMKSTDSNEQVLGSVKFTDTDTGIKVSANLKGLSPGKHGFHIHEYGSCSDAGVAAGGHFNPDGASHGNALVQGVFEAHPGDLGNLTVNSRGEGSLNVELDDLSVIEGIYNIGGRAVIIHASEDDLGQPTGNAGGRVACGSIVIVKPTA